MREFYCKTKIVSGGNALQWLDGQQCRQLLVVTDPYFAQNGWAEEIARRVKAEQREIFSEIKPDPTTGIPSPPLALFIVMLPKAHLTSHSRMSGSR